MTKFLPIEEAVAKIHSGSLLAMSGNNHKSSMAITRELVRQNVGDLKLVLVWKKKYKKPYKKVFRNNKKKMKKKLI